jgi:hypothetical protein
MRLTGSIVTPVWAFVRPHDLIRVHHRVQPVGDDQRGALAGPRLEVVDDRLLGDVLELDASPEREALVLGGGGGSIRAKDTPTWPKVFHSDTSSISGRTMAPISALTATTWPKVSSWRR